jgi:hypothetical protein
MWFSAFVVWVVLAVVPSKEPPCTPAGRWVGTGYQFDTQDTWTIDMTIRLDAKVGEKAGTIAYPSIPCSGELVRKPDVDGRFVVQERLTKNAGRCVDLGTIRVVCEGKNLEWKWFYPADGSYGANASLARP